jgi:hypothetical protein
MKCNCYIDVNERLKDKGFRLSEKLFMFAVDDDLGLTLTMGIPLERLDGKRLQRKDPKTLQISFCPMCGAKQGKDESPGVSEGAGERADTGAADAG